MSSPADLDRRFDAVLNDENADIHRPGKRFVVISKAEGRLALLHEDGRRISVYAFTDTDLALYGEPLWTIKALKTI